MSVPATLQDFRPEKDLSILGVPHRMATDFVGLRAIPFSQNQSSFTSIKYNRGRKKLAIFYQ